MSPVGFISDPLLWIKLISRLHVNITFAPNFSYDLVAERIAKEKQNDPIFGSELDLSSVVCLLDAARSIETPKKIHCLSNFELANDYGVFDNTSFASSLHQFQFLNLPEHRSYITLVENYNNVDFSGGDALTFICPTVESGVGEVLISGPSATSGYFEKPEVLASSAEQLLRGIFLSHQHYNDTKTNDMGYYIDHKNNLYICGCLEDMVTVNGINYFPQDIEKIVQESVPDKVVQVFVTTSSRNDNESGFEIIVEIQQPSVNECTKIVDLILVATVQKMSIVPSRIAVVKEETLLKNERGKIRRRENRKAFYTNKVSILHDTAQTSVSWLQQILKDPPTRLMIEDFSNNTQSTSSCYVNEIFLDSELLVSLERFCRKKQITLLSMTLKILHQSLRAYSHEPFTLGIIRDEDCALCKNIMLVPFGGQGKGNFETVEAFHTRFEKEMLQYTRCPLYAFSMIEANCNVFFAFEENHFNSKTKVKSEKFMNQSEENPYHNVSMW